MIDGTVVKELERVITKPQTITVNGRDQLVLPAGWQNQTPHRPTIAELGVATLGSLIGYLTDNRDRLNTDDLIVHVEDPVTVRVKGRIEDEETRFRRQGHLVATVSATPFPFGPFLDIETFIIQVQTQFVPTAARDQLVSLVASITEKDVVDTTDDGYAQRVTIQQGVMFVGATTVQNPVELAPYRTFREIAQPESPFIVRLQSGAKQGEKPKVGLFEADGGAWRLEAVQSIRKYLAERLPDGVSVIA